jgi:hypothetical protein
MRNIMLALACLIAWVVASSAPVHGRPAHKKALADYFGTFLPRHLNDCRTCHLPDSHGDKKDDPEDKPHNAFGARLVAVKKELTKAGKKADIVSRIEAIAEEDSDGDGVSNILELLAGSNPGEGQSQPTAAELARGKKLLAAFRVRKHYPWKPFEAVQRPAVPVVKNQAWVRNPIDAFIAEHHELHGLQPRSGAPRHVLLRRIYLDLIGLPPTRDEMHAFANDSAPDAYERVVDRLLASPQYGERWARHWMDVWRYVDYGNSGLQDGWTGAPHMWRWRDWIVASLNADKSYDRMVQEMLAADELVPAEPETLAATAYLARNKGNSRDAWLHDTVNHTARAFLGVTMECARCHDHMYDPIKQEEYYRMRAIFEPHTVRTDPTHDLPDPKKNGLTRVIDSNLNPRTYFYIRGVEQNPDKEKVITPGVPSLLGTDGFSVTTVKFEVEGEKPRNSTGRRLAFARWITGPSNPVAARVAVNHMWLRHFGTAIVPSVFDFGAGGLPPTHPALLDWLAAEFMNPSVSGEPEASGWSMKRLHRLIVTSNTYRMSSTPDAANLAADPDNLFYWRMPSRRMEAEVIRDSILHVAGNLDLTMKGLEVDPKQGMEVRRRSIYFRYTDSDYLKVMEFFDAPAVDDCYRRPQSIVPQQALTLLNSDLALTQSRIVARELAQETGDEPSRFVQAAFERILCRKATTAEQDTCLRFLVEQTRFVQENKQRIKGTAATPADATKAAADPALRARESLIHMLLNHHDFVTIR